MSNRTTRNLCLQDLVIALTERQYLLSLIDDGIKRAKKLDIKTLKITNHNTTPHTKTLIYLSTHNPKNYEVFKTIVQNRCLLIRDSKMNNIVKSHILQKGTQIIKETFKQICSYTQQSRNHMWTPKL